MPVIPAQGSWSRSTAMSWRPAQATVWDPISKTKNNDSGPFPKLVIQSGLEWGFQHPKMNFWLSPFRVLGHSSWEKTLLTEVLTFQHNFFFECFFWKRQVPAYCHVRKPVPLCQIWSDSKLQDYSISSRHFILYWVTCKCFHKPNLLPQNKNLSCLRRVKRTWQR